MRAIISKLKRKLKADDTAERCGIVLSCGKVVETENIHDTPHKGFRIPASDLIRYEELMVASWHTHLNGTSILSQEDYEGFCNWPDIKHYIISADGVRCYEVDEGIVSECK